MDSENEVEFSLDTSTADTEGAVWGGREGGREGGVKIKMSHNNNLLHYTELEQKGSDFSCRVGLKMALQST